MSWLRDDDDMLDHEKWRRALRDGGDSALLVWAKLRSWCSRRLTDGLVPADMVDEVAEIGRSKARARALRALVEHGLCARRDDGVITIVGYLERNPSKAQVLQERERRSEAQRKRRLGANVTGHTKTTEPERNEVPAQSRPGPAPSLSNESESTRAPDVPEVPGLEIVHPGPLQPSKREQAREAAAALLTSATPRRFDPSWNPNQGHRERGRELGLSDIEILEEAEDCRRKLHLHGFLTEDDQFFRELTWLARDKEKNKFKSLPKAERDAFENPGRERRA